MNKIIYKYNANTTLTFTDVDEDNQAGRIIEGSFYNETSLLEDELSIDTLTVQVRYEGATPLTSFNYGSEVDYYKNDELYARYYLKDIERNSKYEYTLLVQSAIGLLDDTNHYGGVYTGQTASDVIKEIIGGKINYTEHSVFAKIKVYGWLPISTRRDNLKQLLFAVSGCVRKDSNCDVYFSPLNVDTPISIPENRVYESGKITYNAPASRVEVVEHQFAKVDTTAVEEIYSGGIVGSNFTSPKGYEIHDGAIITWDEPYHSITFEGTTLLNNEVGVNYAIVSSSGNATIKGKPYVHSKSIIGKDKSNYKGKEKIAKVEEATLVSLANSNGVAEKLMAYYEAPNTLSGSIVMNNEKPVDNVTIPNQFEETSTGIIKSIEGTFGKQITKGDVEVRLDYDPPQVYGSRELISIEVTTPPNRVSYEAGETFDATGMVITAYYDDGTSKVVNNYTISPISLSKDTTHITITYKEVLNTATTTLNIEVKNLLKNIVVANPPDIIDYYAEDYFDPTGMIIKAFYSDGSSKEVDNYSYEPTRELTEEDETVTISYTEEGITKTTYQDITVGSAPNLVSITVSTPPNKTSYKPGEFFDTEGMVITASFDNNTSKPIYGYTYSPNGALEIGDDTITISYTKGGITKTTTQSITIYYLVGITITNNPTKMEYYEGDTFNKTGMVVVANYSNDTTKTLADADYTVTPEIMVCSNSLLTVSYTERNITVEAPLIVVVTYYPYDYTNSIVLSEGGTYHLSDFGATHRNLRIIAIGGGTGGNGGMDGENGTAGNDAYIKSGSSGTSGTDSAETQGGKGGLSGTKGQGGLVYAYDIVLDDANQDIVISIGNGGTGGAKDTYQDEHTDTSIGQVGTDTTCVIGDLTISSSEGNRSDEGYTNIFTDEKFAQCGTDGTDGTAGGKGGGGGMDGQDGVDNPPKEGGAAGTYTDSGSRSVFKETGGASPTVKETSSSSTSSSYPITSSHTWRVNTGYGSTSWGELSYTGSWVTMGTPTGYTKYKKSGSSYQAVTIYPFGNSYNTGYDSLSKDTYPTTTEVSGTYRSSIRKIKITSGTTSEKYYTSSSGTNGSTQTYIKSVTFTTITKTSTFYYDSTTVYYRTASGAGGGGGASIDNNGNNASLSAGGNGADAITPSIPSQYGRGGDGGNGAGGGGGGGHGYVSISGNKSWTGVGYSVSGGAAGTGGTGADGGTGANGCVIIYFS